MGKKTETHAVMEPPKITPPVAVATHEDDPILTMSEVARRVGKSPQTVARWIHDGLLRAIRHPSGLPGIRQSEVNKFLGGSALPVREIA